MTDYSDSPHTDQNLDPEEILKATVNESCSGKVKYQEAELSYIKPHFCHITIFHNILVVFFATFPHNFLQMMKEAMLHCLKT